MAIGGQGGMGKYVSNKYDDLIELVKRHMFILQDDSEIHSILEKCIDAIEDLQNEKQKTIYVERHLNSPQRSILRLVSGRLDGLAYGMFDNDVSLFLKDQADILLDLVSEDEDKHHEL